jgi:hypothetical protein
LKIIAHLNYQGLVITPNLKMAEESPSKASAFFIDRLVQPLLGGLNPSFAPVSDKGQPGLSLNLMTRNFRRFSARYDHVSLLF